MKLLRVVFFVQFALAATVTYEWDITWVEANPDGALLRPVIGMPLRQRCPPDVLLYITNID